ncbi:hypothetical protein CBI38_33065 (plasmid) [Rhodococcus oxybenzonivorans]|uniref:Uncharacterized protein n=1 Tax=Rhodococcus oxybenzonivorans TaxID=1990687 RepID=A0A2S2C5Z1_9NOCA|nr:hypothetical protein CBI38_33065 [Rhodococcus oxybenzonivorans]
MYPRCAFPGPWSRLLVGPALGLAGALMQGATGYPLPIQGSILGINAGAALAVLSRSRRLA